MVVIEKSELKPDEILTMIAQANDVKQLKKQIKIPFGTPQIIAYDVNAPKGKWVIKSVDGAEQDRKYDKWKN